MNNDVVHCVGDTVPVPPLAVTDIEDKRRTLRMRKSSLLQLKLEDMDRPAIKIAETLDEYKQAFKIAHDEYVRSGYITANPEHPYHFSPFSLRPDSCIFIFKYYLTVVATLTEFSIPRKTACRWTNCTRRNLMPCARRTGPSWNFPPWSRQKTSACGTLSFS